MFFFFFFWGGGGGGVKEFVGYLASMDVGVSEPRGGEGGGRGGGTLLRGS